MGRGSARRAGTRSPVRCPRTAPSRRGRRPGSRSARSSASCSATSSASPRCPRRRTPRTSTACSRPTPGWHAPRSSPTAASSRSSSATRSSGYSASPRRTRTTPCARSGPASPSATVQRGLQALGGTTLRLRVGVNTGEALVRLDVAPESGERFMTGDAINTASRIQSVAPEQGVAVGEVTWQATRPTVEYVDLPPATLKGKTDPVRVFQATASANRPRDRPVALPRWRLRGPSRRAWPAPRIVRSSGD